MCQGGRKSGLFAASGKRASVIVNCVSWSIMVKGERIL